MQIGNNNYLRRQASQAKQVADGLHWKGHERRCQVVVLPCRSTAPYSFHTALCREKGILIREDIAR